MQNASKSPSLADLARVRSSKSPSLADLADLARLTLLADLAIKLRLLFLKAVNIIHRQEIVRYMPLHFIIRD